MSDRWVKLTTIDNPWNPFTQWDAWYRFDAIDHDYCTLSHIARHAALNEDALTEEENEREWERAMDDIIEHDFQNIYVKVTPESYENWVPKPYTTDV